VMLTPTAQPMDFLKDRFPIPQNKTGLHLR
jgi:hypothetical protein